MSPRETPARRCARRAPRTLMRDAVAGFVHRGWQAVQAAAVITAETAAGRRLARFGAGSSMAFPPGAVFGERWIEVGEDTIIGMHVTMCAGMVPGQDLGPQPVLRVGDRCAIGRGSHIVAHLSVQIGDDVFTGPYVYITDQDHGYADPYLPIGRQWPSNNTMSIPSRAWRMAGARMPPRDRVHP